MSKRIFYILGSIFTLFLSIPATEYTYPEMENNCECDPTRDSLALIAFRNTLTVRDSVKTIDDMWSLTQPLSEWEGITLDEEGCVEKLELFNQFLEGALPIAIFRDLKCVSIINLGSKGINYSEFDGIQLIDNGQNTFNGSAISETIEQLKKLEVLNLQYTNLDGVLPPTLAKLPNLKALYLRGNALKGGIPLNLSEFPQLRILDLGQNFALNRFIPSDIGRISSLEELYLDSTDVKGDIPASIGELVNLRILDLEDTNLSGTIPKEIGNLHKLEILRLKKSNFLGPIPNEMGKLTLVKALDLDIVSPIPIGIGDMTSLESLILRNAEGNIPPDLGKLQNLKFLSIHNIESDIPDEIGQLKKLEAIKLCCNINDITSEIGKMKALKSIDLAVIHSSLPPEIGELENLESIILRSEGTEVIKLPSTIKNLNKLHTLTLTSNSLAIQLSPAIGNFKNLENFKVEQIIRPPINDSTYFLPDAITNIPNLQSLSINCGELRGVIPIEIGAMDRLKNLQLENHHLIGTIPESISQLENLVTLNLQSNQLSGIIPSNIGDLKKLVVINLGDNLLEGEIPSTIGDLTGLSKLILDKNKLTGELPSSIEQLVQLETLLLNDNQLSGELPKQLNQLEHLREITLEDNQFQGIFPSSISASIQNNQFDSLPILTQSINDISNNRFTFDDIIPNLSFVTTIGPQNAFIHPTNYILNRCNPPILKLGIDNAIAENTYQWYKNGTFIGETPVNQLILSEFYDFEEYAGVYTCTVSNALLPTLILTSDSIIVETTNNLANEEIIEFKNQLCVGERIELFGKYYDCINPRDTFFEVNPETNCITTNIINLSCSSCQNIAFAPSAITPNGDNFNENFVIPKLIEMPQLYRPNELKIYNQYKELVYQQENYRNDWNGLDLFGRALDIGTYYYHFSFGQPKTIRNGIVTIIR